MKRAQWVFETALLATVYVLAARFGLGLDPVAGFATLVWAPTGLSIAALLLRGYRLWPGVAVGALIANLASGAPPEIALLIAAGNTLEAVVAVYALRQVPGFRPSLDRLRDVVAFIFFGAILSTAISATIGVTALRLGGILDVAGAADAWRAWWLGDAVGALVIAPMILVWASTEPAFPRARRMVETLLLGGTVIVTSALVFGIRDAAATDRLWPYMLFPPLIWAALRFGRRGSVSAVFGSSVIAVFATVNGFGPFATGELHASLLALQIFMGVLAVTFLTLGAAASEGRRASIELERARARAEDANRTKAEFLAVVSHELRTPLNAISGYGELLTMELGGPLTDPQRDAIERIRRNAKHLLTMIDEVLSFTRSEAGRLRFTTTHIPLAEAIQEIEPVVAPEIQRKELTLSHELPSNTLGVRADPEKLRQILLNLVGNAMKFTPAGGRITVGARREGAHARLWVADTGVGIPADKLARVFEPFYQVDGGSTRRYPGFGLGLAIARDFARAMNGELYIESSPGAGTTVSLVLPAAERDSTLSGVPGLDPHGDGPASNETRVN
jgi:signal transduction histidine kinase